MLPEGNTRRFSSAGLHREPHQARQHRFRIIGHVIRRIPKRKLLAQMIGRLRGPFCEFIRDDDFCEAVGAGAISDGLWNLARAGDLERIGLISGAGR
ncbi:hypothetical protein ACM42_33470 [Bradyrhizobium sp. CCBAU 25338]|nr:hypothetical protein [Bradyrhizobium sp. CCBAU 25338]